MLRESGGVRWQQETTRFSTVSKGSPGQPESAPGEKGGRMLGEFKDFAMRGSMIDMAVGIIVGAAFGRVVTINMSKM